MIPLRSAPLQQIVQNPSVWGTHMSYKLIEQNGKTAWYGVQQNELVRLPKPPKHASVKPQSLTPATSLEKFINKFQADYTSDRESSGRSTPDYSPKARPPTPIVGKSRSPSPTSPIHRAGMWDPTLTMTHSKYGSFSTLTDELDDITSATESMSISPPQKRFKAAFKPRTFVGMANFVPKSPPPKTSSGQAVMLSPSISASSVGSCSCVSEKSTTKPSKKQRVTAEEIRQIGDDVAVETMFDGFTVETLRDMRELARRKATAMGRSILVTDIIAVVHHVMDQHMELVSLTATWRDTSTKKWEIEHLNNLSKGVFKKRDDESLKSRFKATIQDLTTDIMAGLRLGPRNLPNQIPKSSF